MANFTIQEFWKPRLAVSRPKDAAQMVAGWFLELTGLPTFLEAPLNLNRDLSDAEADGSANIVLVSAPGAVGKSTLAREIAYATGAVYVDLSRADPVGGNTLSGGLVRSGLYDSWKMETTTALIDGLDEARLRVTQEAFAAFLSDVAALAKRRKTPIVLFGRTGSVEVAWLVLKELAARCTVLEIGYYDADAAIKFAEAQLKAAGAPSAHADAQREVISLLLGALRTETESDGDRFAGYAPVLQAIADRVANESNPSALLARIRQGQEVVTLQSVATAIMNRERSKLGNLPFDDQKLATSLYQPAEQLDRLVGRTYGLPPPQIPAMSAKDSQLYSQALDSWVSEHPFLNGGQGTSSVVFEALITAHAMKDPVVAAAAVQRELSRGSATNPFVSEFYLPANGGPIQIPPEHIGVVYSSIRARLSLGDMASLTIEGEDESEKDDDLLRADVEIAIARGDVDRSRTLQFSTDQAGTLRLGRYIEDVDITASLATVEIGPGSEAVLVAPVSIICSHLLLTTETVTAEPAPGVAEGAVYLEAEKFDGPKVTTVPNVRAGASLAVSWPNARVFPWNSCAISPTPPQDDPHVEEGLRRLRKFILAFRSHSKGSLARYRPKIEHARMTKGAGQAVLDALLAESVLSLNGNKYILDPDQLGKVVGVNYQQAINRSFAPSAAQFVKRALHR